MHCCFVQCECTIVLYTVSAVTVVVYTVSALLFCTQLEHYRYVHIECTIVFVHIECTVFFTQ